MDNLIVGNTYRLRGTFRTVLRILANPTTVTLRIEDPDGNVEVVASGSITNESTGVYYYDFAPDQAGRWYYRFIGAGAVIATNPETFLAVAARP